MYTKNTNLLFLLFRSCEREGGWDLGTDPVFGQRATSTGPSPTMKIVLFWVRPAPPNPSLQGFQLRFIPSDLDLSALRPLPRCRHEMCFHLSAMICCVKQPAVETPGPAASADRFELVASPTSLCLCLCLCLSTNRSRNFHTGQLHNFFDLIHPHQDQNLGPLNPPEPIPPTLPSPFRGRAPRRSRTGPSTQILDASEFLF